MFIYNQTVFAFIQKVEKIIKDILKNEVKLEVLRSRFIKDRYYYPINTVVFTDLHKLGYFDSKTLQIGLSESLIYEVREHVLKDIIRHELAHYLNFIECKEKEIKPHGEEFQRLCLRYGWDRSISKASMDIQDYKTDVVGNLDDEKVLAKVKKLLSLASSSNENEAEIATLKANHLLLKHNIKKSQLGENYDDDTIYLKRLMSSKRRNSKITAVYDILKHFYVNPVLRYHSEGVYLEICGNKVNIELADYVFNFLDTKLDQLWLEHKKNDPKLKGLKAKNSFFYGLAQGYDKKVQDSHADFDRDEQKSLVQIKNAMSSHVKKIYSRMSSTSSNSSIDSSAYSLGKKAGNNLSINKAIKSKTKSIFRLGFNS